MDNSLFIPGTGRSSDVSTLFWKARFRFSVDQDVVAIRPARAVVPDGDLQIIEARFQLVGNVGATRALLSTRVNGLSVQLRIHKVVNVPEL